jgi:hypothetical protein
MNAKDLIFLSKRIDLRYCAGGFHQSLRYMDAYRQGATRAGRLAAFANKKYTSHRCLPASWLTGYKVMFGEKFQESMLDMNAVAAELVGCSVLGWDREAEDEDSDGGADDEGVSDAAEQEPGGDARGVEVTDDNSEEVDEDAFASSSKASDAAEEVATARVDRGIGRALCQIAVLEASAITAPAREGGVNAQG